MNVPWNEPFQRFGALYEQAKHAQPKDPNAMTVATVDAEGRPSARVCLLKGFDESGFVFYTNGDSRKGRELRGQPVAALCFYWPALGEQVRVEGTVAPVADEESEAYFASRPRDSQLGAWASLQSQPMSSRELLDSRLAEITKQLQGQQVPRPAHWGGFRVTPTRIEFWKAHPYRLHFREQFDVQGDGWSKETLFP